MSVTVNGVDISNLAYNVSTLTGRWTSPPKRGKDIDIPGRHGVVWTPGKKFSSGTMILSMWANGCNTDGTLPTDKLLRALVQKNIDRLAMLFSKDVVTVVSTLEDGSQRQVVGQVVDAIDMSAMAGATRAEFAVTLSVPGAFASDVSTTVTSKTGTGAWSISALSGATAPMDDMKVKFTAPCTNPRFTSSDGVWIQYSAVLSGSQAIELDCGLWTLTGTGITPNYAAVEHSGDPRWFVLSPGDPIPAATFSQTAGSTGSVQLTGKRKFLFSG